MALTISTNSNFCRDYPKHFSPKNPKFEVTSSQLFVQFHKHHDSFTSSAIIRRRQLLVVYGLGGDSGQRDSQDDELNSLGVKAALSMLRFYKREISPLLPSSCRYVPTCSEYSMIAYKKYGVVKGTVLTAWRLCRCNPLGEQDVSAERRCNFDQLPFNGDFDSAMAETEYWFCNLCLSIHSDIIYGYNLPNAMRVMVNGFTFNIWSRFVT